jgi:hypothetical protein
MLSHDVPGAGAHQCGPVAQKRLGLLRPPRSPQRGDAGRTGTRVACGQQRREHLVVGVSLRYGSERRRGAQVLNDAVLIPRGRAGQLGGP